MKWVNIILSIYLIVLSSLPCADTLDSETKAHTNEIISKTDSQSHENGLDLCTPFCSCSCCAIQVLNTTPIITLVFNDTPTTLIKNPLSSYNSIVASNFYGSIWQPPKIV